MDYPQAIPRTLAPTKQPVAGNVDALRAAQEEADALRADVCHFKDRIEELQEKMDDNEAVLVALADAVRDMIAAGKLTPTYALLVALDNV